MCEQVFPGTGVAWYRTFGVISLVVMVILLFLFILKFILYPRKIFAEWDCPGMLSLSKEIETH